MKLGKSPGLDGLFVLNYKTFSEILTQPFLRVFNTLAQLSQPLVQLLEAHITILDKMDKDATLV